MSDITMTNDQLAEIVTRAVSEALKQRGLVPGKKVFSTRPRGNARRILEWARAQDRDIVLLSEVVDHFRDEMNKAAAANSLAYLCTKGHIVRIQFGAYRVKK